ncbi:MAG: hypothetical protein LBU62_06060 [Bacteroidales bacterium]|jgi:hypothetical protein|nr:hypothetical protein [Bacteroidales bacterium]
MDHLKTSLKILKILNMKTRITGMICAICLFAMSQCLTAQTIQFKGGSCVLDTVVEIPGGSMIKYARVDFKYTLNENATIKVLHVLLDKGLFVVKKNKYKANGIVFDTDEWENVNAKKDGIVSLVLSIPSEIKIKSLKFVYNKQEIPLDGGIRNK